jgi:hypothetical protein
MRQAMAWLLVVMKPVPLSLLQPDLYGQFGPHAR